MAARKYKRLTYHAYIFAAHLEWQVNKNTELASKIYHSGLDKYASSTQYIDRYVEWLQCVGDHANMRLVVERVVKEGEEEGRKRRQREEDERLKGRTKKRRGGGGGGGGGRDRREDREDMEDMDVYRAPLWSFGRSTGSNASDTAADTIDATDNDSLTSAGSGIGGVWWRYVELERWTATELSGVTKVEERREVALGLRSPRSALLIDRYRFMDLYPCSSAMRRTVELLVRPDLVLSSHTTHSTHSTPHSHTATSTSLDTARTLARQYTRPTLTALTAIDPSQPPPDPGFFRRRYPGVGSAVLGALIVLAGGAGEGRWLGPLYDVQGVLERLRDVAVDERLRESTPAVAAAVAVTAAGAGADEVKEGAVREGKRKRAEQEGGGDADAEGKEDVVSAKAAVGAEIAAAKTDLFRQRRQNKIPKQH